MHHHPFQHHSFYGCCEISPQSMLPFKPIIDQQKKAVEPGPTMGDTRVFYVVCLKIISCKLVHVWFSSCHISLCLPFSPLTVVAFHPNAVYNSAGCLKVCIHGVTLCCYLSRGKVRCGRDLQAYALAMHTPPAGCEMHFAA